MFPRPLIRVQVITYVTEPRAREGIHWPSRCCSGSTLPQPPRWSADPHTPAALDGSDGCEAAACFFHCCFFSVREDRPPDVMFYPSGLLCGALDCVCGNSSSDPGFVVKEQ